MDTAAQLEISTTAVLQTSAHRVLLRSGSASKEQIFVQYLPVSILRFARVNLNCCCFLSGLWHTNLAHWHFPGCKPECFLAIRTHMDSIWDTPVFSLYVTSLCNPPGVPEKFKLYLDEGSKRWDCIGTVAEKHWIRKLMHHLTVHHLPGDKGWSEEKTSISPPEWRDSNLCPHREEENRELILKTQFLTGIKPVAQSWDSWSQWPFFQRFDGCWNWFRCLQGSDNVV